MAYNIPRLVLAAPGSGAGKTTMACALLQVMMNRGLSPAAFKCGPDYIDPMFHSQVIGAKAHNMDLYFVPEDRARFLFQEGIQGCGVALIEGAMGFYDGVAGKSTQASAYHVAQVLKAPVVLVVQPGGSSLTLAATLKGLLEFREESGCRGILLNRCSKGHYALLKPMLEEELGIPVLGYLPPMPECALESRHLGLVTAEEVAGLREKLAALAAQAEETIDIPRLLELMASAPPLEEEVLILPSRSIIQPVIALARDKAFCFYYQENLELLEKLGAKLVYFSPLEDEGPPEEADALYLGGGYPELYARQLSQNQACRENVKQAASRGMPVLAECGGFLYLQKSLQDEEGSSWPMAGVLPGEGFPTGKLGRFGYVEVTSWRTGLMCPREEKIRGHEFHYWDSTQPGEDAFAKKPLSTRTWECVHTGRTLWAGFPHLYFYSNLGFAARFVAAAAEYQKQKRDDKQ